MKDGELLRRELEVPDNPKDIQILTTGQIDIELTNAIFSLFKPLAAERCKMQTKTAFVFTRNTDFDLSPQAKEYLQELYRQGYEILFF